MCVYKEVKRLKGEKREENYNFLLRIINKIKKISKGKKSFPFILYPLNKRASKRNKK